MTLKTMTCRATSTMLWSTVLVIGSMALMQAVQGQSRGPASNGPVRQVAAQENPWVIPGTDSGSASATLPENEPTTIGGYGVNGRIGHMTGPAVGHKESFSFLEIAPYTTYEETWLAADFRVLRTNRGFTAMSGGVIARRFCPSLNAIFGANAFFDADETRRGKRFQQGGFGFELLTENLDVRSNFYIPSGTQTAVIEAGIVDNSARFADNRILFDGFRVAASAAHGADMLFTVPIPGDLAESANLEASAGWYHFQASDDNVRKLTGWRVRMDASSPKRMLHLFTEFTEDAVFDKNLIVGADLNYWHKSERGPRLGQNQFNRISQWVERQWTVTTVDERLIDAGLVATNPGTGNAYFIEHVDTNAAVVGNGTFEVPYQTLPEAQINAPAAGPDNIIFVHSGSQFNAPIVLNPLETVFGEGIIHTLPVVGFANPLQLPGIAGPRPVIDLTGVNGDAITMANDSTIAGFVVQNVLNGNGVTINGVTNATVRGVDITNVTGLNGRGVEIINSAGNINLLDMNISDTDQESLYIEGGTADIVLGTSNSTSPLSTIIANAAGAARSMSTVRVGRSTSVARPSRPQPGPRRKGFWSTTFHSHHEFW